MSDRAFWTGCFWVLVGPPLLVVWILATVTLYGLGGDAGTARSASYVGTARVTSCEQVGRFGLWGVGSRQRCTADVDLETFAAPDIVLPVGLAGNADVGHAVAVAAVAVTSGRTRGPRLDPELDPLFGEGQGQKFLVVRNQDRVVRSWSTAVLAFGIGGPLLLLGRAVRSSSPDPLAPGGKPGFTRAQSASLPRWAMSARTRWLRRTAKLGVLVVVLLTALDVPPVLVEQVSGDGHRWPGLPDAAPLTLPIGGFLLFVAWGVTSFVGSRERVRAARVLHLGPVGAAGKDHRSRWSRADLTSLAADAEAEREQVGDEVVVRRRSGWRGTERWGFALLSVVGAGVSWVQWGQSLSAHVQPWWVDVAGTWTAVILTAVTAALVLPDESPISRLRRLLVLRERSGVPVPE